MDVIVFLSCGDTIVVHHRDTHYDFLFFLFWVCESESQK